MNRWLVLGGLAVLLLGIAVTSDVGAQVKVAKPPAAATGADWPTFRGPNRDSISPDKGLLKSWPKDGPKLAWPEPAKGLGTGFSGVSVVGPRVFTMGDVGDSCFVFALDRGTGKKLWEARVGKSGAPGGYAGPRCTPTVDGDHVYALGQLGNLVCLEVSSGKEVWSKDLTGMEFAGRVGSWGYSESPLIDGDKLLCTPGGKGATIVALDKKTGAVIWRAVVPGDRAEYSSMTIAEVGGIRMYVQLLASNVAGINAADGSLLWTYNKLGNNTANIPTPVVKGDLVFCTAGYSKGGALLKLTARGKQVTAQEIYYNPALGNRHGGVVLVGGFLFGDKDQNGNPWCANFLTGQTNAAWKKQSKGSGSMSLTYADGHLYCRYANGVVALVEATPVAYRETGSFRIPNVKGPSWPHPVVIDGRLYLREQDMLWVHNVKE